MQTKQIYYQDPYKKGLEAKIVSVKGDLVNISIDWNSRLRYMRLHSADHLLHDILMTIFPDIVPLKGSHGKKAFLEYQGMISSSQKNLIEQKTNEYLQKSLTITTKEAAYDELEKECQFVPSNLPKGKPLRMIKNRRLPRNAGWWGTRSLYKGNW